MTALAALCVFALTLGGSITALPAFVLWIAADAAFAGTVVETSRYILCFAAACSIPISVWLCGLLVDRFAFENVCAHVFAPAGLLLACGILLSEDSLYRLLEAAASSRDLHLSLAVERVFALLGSVVYASGLSAFVVISVPLCVEIPVQWLRNGRAAEIPAIRPLVILAVTAIAFHFLSDFFGRVVNWRLLH